MRKTLVELVGVVATVATLACSPGGGSGEPGDPGTPSLSVSPTEWSVTAGGAPKQFTAMLTGSSGPVVWSLEALDALPPVGTISSAGLYTPPPSLGVGRVVVVKAAAGSLVAQATVHVGPGMGGITLVVTPATASVVAGSGQTVALHAETSYAGTITWTVPYGLGTLLPSSGADVTYTAPAGLVTATTEVGVSATAGAITDAATITVRPSALQLTGPATVRAGGAPVVYSITTDIGASAVAWSVTPASAGLISGAGVTGTFTPAATVGADTPFQVTATIGEATGSASSTLLPPPAGPVTIAGTVTDEEGRGLSGAKVIIGDQSTTTAASGTFSVPSVTSPYDATVIAPDGKTVSVFRGVENAAPVLWFYDFTAPIRSAEVRGTVTLDAAPFPADVFTGSSRVDADGTTGAYAFAGAYEATWERDLSTTLTLRALATAFDVATFRPDGRYWFGSRSVPVTDGGAVAGQDIAVAQLGSGHVIGTMTPGGGTITFTLSTRARFPDGTTFPIWDTTPSMDEMIAGTFDVMVPELPSGSVQVGAAGSGAFGGGASIRVDVVPGGAGVALAVPSLPEPGAPADGASGITYGTSFAWTTDDAGGTHSVAISCAGGITYRIHGGGTSATIPDLTAFGVTLAPGQSCTWHPEWDGYQLADLVGGPAAVDALGFDRHAYAAPRSFTF